MVVVDFSNEVFGKFQIEFFLFQKIKSVFFSKDVKSNINVKVIRNVKSMSIDVINVKLVVFNVV